MRGRVSSPRTSRKGRPPAISVPGEGKWQALSPRSADRLLGHNGGGGVTGFGDTFSPGGSPRFPSRGRRDSRKNILMNMTYANLFFALVLLIVGGVGPQYPGHSGTTDNAFTDRYNRRLTTQDSPLYQANCPTDEVDKANASILHSALIVGLVIWLTQPCSARRISKKVDRPGAAATLLTSVVCACTCLGAFAVVMVDINYIAGCCSLLEDNCEVSDLCTEFVDDCCISNDVKDYCGNPSYHVGAVSMIFLVFVSTSAMVIMAGTMTARCWLDSDPEKQAMMMVLAGSPLAHPSTSKTQISSPTFAPRKTPLAPTDDRDRAAGGGGKTRSSRPSASSTTGGEATREKCPHCGAVFGNVATLVNHVERFHTKGRGSGGGTGERVETSSGAHRKPLARKGSLYTPDEGPLVAESGIV